MAESDDGFYWIDVKRPRHRSGVQVARREGLVWWCFGWAGCLRHEDVEVLSDRLEPPKRDDLKGEKDG